MKRIRKGFTLVELVVVTVIMGILASMSVPYYFKTVETSKATNAVAIGHLLSSAYRIFRVDNPTVILTGPITNSCNSGACAIADRSGCRLVRCNYVVRQDNINSSYNFTLGAAGVRVARFRGRGVYARWGYNFTMTGACSINTGSTTPSCPKF